MFISIFVFILVLSVHEFAHGYAAYRLGDTTARDAGRLTLNPLAHIDPVGTVMLPAMLAITHSPVIFGWAKPVPIDPRNFKDPAKGMLLTSLAGPASNFLLAFLFGMILRTHLFAAYSALWSFLVSGIMISLVLGIFNLVPIPPLDGSGILAALLPPKAAVKFMLMRKYGFIVLIGLLYLGLFDRVILPLVRFLTKVILSL
ncbi:MAG: site-2 protease family protein [Candidatus Omnitrophota bacterium]